VAAAYYGSVDAIGAALRQGDDIEELDTKENWRPLHAAVFTDSADAVLYLLRMRANVNAPGPQGRSPLHMAARDNSDEIVEILLSKGADPGLLDDKGQTAASIATEHAACRALQKLQEACAGHGLDPPAAAPALTSESSPPPTPSVPSFMPSVGPALMAGGASWTPAQPSPSGDQTPSPPDESLTMGGDVPGPCGSQAAGMPSPWFGTAVDPEDEQNLDLGRETLPEDWETK